MRPSIILRTSAPLLLWVPIVVSLYILVRGHNDPGGGFLGGLMAAAGILFYVIARGAGAARRVMRISPIALCGAGVLVATASGLPSLVDPAVGYLTHLWWLPDIGFEFAIGTALVFDVGVYLTVVGSIAAFLLALVEEGPR